LTDVVVLRKSFTSARTPVRAAHEHSQDPGPVRLVTRRPSCCRMMGP
jgi:hypothetical protein